MLIGHTLMWQTRLKLGTIEYMLPSSLPKHMSDSVSQVRACLRACWKFSKLREEDPAYMKTKHLLKSLGLEKYENNFKRGMLNDYTLPLLTDRQVLEFMCFVIY